ncbi:MAG: aldo/keto reductase [Erysipelotrichaceae bacterium]|nr:aldo/keto reductase [Erysipelotrichaceae bacterium]
MKQIRLGQTDMYVNPVGLGCMGFSHASGAPTPHDEAIAALRAAHEMGYNFYDTAECYTGVNPDGSINYNEELVGEAVAPFRDQIILCTKFGVTHKGDHLEFDSSPEKIRQSIEGSLKRLGTDYVDLYYQHRIDPKVEPEVVAGVMKELIEEGKIKAWGISETTEEYLRRAHAVCPVTAIENRYSMMARWHESIFPVCEELGITYVAFSPMANGALTGAYQSNKVFAKDGSDFRANMPQYTEEGIKKTNELLEVVSQIAQAHNATNAQISLAWMICKKPFIVPIPGSRKIERLQSNFDAGKVELSPEEIKIIDDKLDTMTFDVFGGHAGK